MQYIDVANIACGFHAGDPTIMLKTIKLAKAHGVKTGAHPGIDDKFGFGRRQMVIHPDDMYASILYQVGALKAMLDAEGLELSHIKPHGELYFYMQRDEGIMRAVLKACKVFKGVPVYACKNEMQARICEEMGVPFQEEVYVDIDYSPEGKLVGVAGSKQATPEDIERRIVQAAQDQREHQGGGLLDLGFGGKPFSICLHSDMPTALDNARIGRQTVDEANRKKGFKVRAVK
jgi:lactam utilization protein B